MKKRYLEILLLLVILSVITAINCVSATDNIDTNMSNSDTFEVHISPEGNDDLGDGSSENQFKSLGYAISYTSNDTTVYLNEGTYVVKKTEIFH